MLWAGGDLKWERKISVWHLRGPGGGENAMQSRAPKAGASQLCTWSCKEGPVPWGCPPVLAWEGSRKGPKFCSPNSKKALFRVNKGSWPSWFSKDNSTGPGNCKVTWNTCTSHLPYSVVSLRHSTGVTNVRLDELFTISNVYFGPFSAVWVWGQWWWCCLADLFMLGRRLEEGGVYPWSRWLFQAAWEESACLICIQTASPVPISQ